MPPGTPQDPPPGPPFAERIVPLTPAPLAPEGLADADDAMLVLSGRPPRPPRQYAEALALWETVVTPVREIRVMELPLARGDIAVSRSFRNGAGLDDAGGTGGAGPIAGLGGGSRMASSLNWSGAVLLPHRGDRFVQVLARWVVPEATPGAGPGPFVCSTWIGLDGFRRWMDSLPQMGTAQVNGDTGETGPPYFAWIQWWLRGQGIQAPVPIANAPIAPGDIVSCVLTRLPPDQPFPGDRDVVQFFLAVNGIGLPVILRAPPGKSHRVPSRGASAEWILERPKALRASPNGNVPEGGLYPLPDFGAAQTDAFAAVLAPAPPTGVVATQPAPPLHPASDFRAPRLVRMLETRPAAAPLQTALIARPRLVSGEIVRVEYRG